MFSLRTSWLLVSFCMLLSCMHDSSSFVYSLEVLKESGFAEDEAFCESVRARPKSKQPYRTAVCTRIHDEAPYIREWIEYHLMLKLDHFYVYNDGSTDNIEEVLQPYIEKGIVSLIHWDKNRTVDSKLVEQEPAFTLDQRYSIADCIYHHQHEAEWIGVWDVDEFLYVDPAYKDFQDLLSRFIGHTRDYLQIPMTVYGPSDHKDKPDGLVMENYRWRTNHTMFGYNTELKKFLGKSMYRSGCGAVGVHMAFEGRLPEHCNPESDWIDFATTPNYPFHLKHFFSKSFSEYVTKMAKWGWEPEMDLWNAIVKQYHDQEDTTMSKYVPNVKRILNCKL